MVTVDSWVVSGRLQRTGVTVDAFALDLEVESGGVTEEVTAVLALLPLRIGTWLTVDVLDSVSLGVTEDCCWVEVGVDNRVTVTFQRGKPGN